MWRKLFGGSKTPSPTKQTQRQRDVGAALTPSPPKLLVQPEPSSAAPSDSMDIMAKYAGEPEKRSGDVLLESIKSEVERNPQNAKNWFDLATCYLGRLDYEKSIQALEKAIELDDSHPEWIRMLVECYIGCERWNDAGPMLLRLLSNSDWTVLGPAGERLTLMQAIEMCASRSSAP